MFELAAKGGIAHVIQLAIAPVFLLTGVGAILNVMANRLSRIVDRARALELKLANGEGDARTELLSRPQSDRTVLRNGVAIDTTLPDYRELDDLMEA